MYSQAIGYPFSNKLFDLIEPDNSLKIFQVKDPYNNLFDLIVPYIFKGKFIKYILYIGYNYSHIPYVTKLHFT